MEGWKETEIEKVVVKTKMKNPTNEPYKQFYYVDVSGVSNTLFKIAEPTLLYGKDAPSRARKLIQFEDVIFATVRPTLKRIAFVPIELDGQICSTGYCVLKADKRYITSKFLYFSLLTDFFIEEIEKLQRGASYPAIRDYDLKSQKIFLPPLPEQRKIAYILNTVQQAIEQQDKLIRTTTELKKALMQKLFTEGINGEKQKQTEIGLVPESWEVVKVGDVFKFSSGKSRPKNTTKEKTDKNQIPVYGGNGILGYTNEVLISETKLILGRVGEYCGCAHLTEFASWISDNALYAKERYKEVDLIFIKNLFEWMNFNQYSNKMGQPLITQGIINDVKFGLPKLDEQKTVAKYISSIERKISYHQQKKQSLTALFKTLLHELMTGQRRVNEINLEKTVKLYEIKEPPLAMAAEEKVEYAKTKRT
ncbi:MAG: restriction endonuclease subunit S [Prevotellaceae bacterium]|jgi:type I restriction enzyme S subunit|nr:restriction endonuclease subunit S [Prevotellaceae bacterium]